MVRLIVPRPSSARAVAAGAAPADNTLARLVKYIPAEVVTGYMFFSGLVEAASQNSSLRVLAAWGLFFLGLVLTPAYLWRYLSTNPQVSKVQRWHLVISTVSFALWAYALGGPFKTGEPILAGYPYEPWFASLLAGAYSWAVAYFWNPEEAPPTPPNPPHVTRAAAPPPSST